MKNEINKNENIFILRFNSLLNNQDVIALRRSFGNTLNDASVQALQAFYKICFRDEKNEEAAFLAACAIAYISSYGQKGLPFWKCLKNIEISESRLKALLSSQNIDKDGLFHAKYSRIIRYCVSKGCIPDVQEIYILLNKWYNNRIELIKKYYNNEK